MTTPKESIAAWEVAGFAFRQPLAAEKLLVPESIFYRQGRLHWRYEGHESAQGQFESGQARHPSAGLIREFIKLGGAKPSPRRITKFAQQWGLLGICRHGQPGYHARFETLGGNKALVWCLPKGGFSLEGSEPIEPWHHLANEFTALMHLASDVSQGGLGSSADWLAIGVPFSLQATWGAGPEGRRDALASRINRMLLMADARLRMRWFEHTPALELWSQGLYGALVGQLALELTRLSGHMFCYHCRRFEEGRRLPEGQRHFCKKCRRKGVPRMYASRNYRTKGGASKEVRSL